MAEQNEVGSKASRRSDATAERRCVVTRQNFERDGLIRFVQSPEGQIVPDLASRLPGRGVWVGAHRALVEKAVAGNLFAKSLKTKVGVASDLARRVDELLETRAIERLSMANKAGLVTSGFEKVYSALEGQNIAAILHGADGATAGRLKIDRKFKAIQSSRGSIAPIVDILTIDQLSLALGRGSVVHAALIPGGLSDRFLEEAERLARYRSLPDEVVDKSPEVLTEG